MSAKLSQENEWQLIQDRLAESSGLAIVVVDKDSLDLAKSNNNSICQVLYNSDEFKPECAKFCGRAFEWATEAGKTIEYKCYAGLNCVASPVKTETKQLVTIVGRTFLKAEDYRTATTRAISGDWQKFPPTKFFENVLLSSSMQSLKATAKRLENLSAEDKIALLQITKEQTGETGEAEVSQANEISRLIKQFHDGEENSAALSKKLIRQNGREAEEISEWRSLLGSLLGLSYSQACESVSQFVSRRYSISSLIWLERKGNRLENAFAVDKRQMHQLQLSIPADDERLFEAVKKETSFELREVQVSEKTGALRTIHLFPIVVGGEIRSAFIVGDEISGENTKRYISRFSQKIAPQLEILRLREQLNRRSQLECAMQKFNESVGDIDADDFWSSIGQISAELMRAERSSILVFDEKSNSLSARAATGARADIIKRKSENLGKKIAQKVLQTGKPLVIQNIPDTEIAAAPLEWNYKSNSFISCPIVIGRRKIGVLNVTDRADGEKFGEIDLEILNAIMPQLAVLIDRALLEHKAGEFEQLSVTDALTELMNRRYLEARLDEEIRRAKRAKRDDFQMSFMTIDVDNFKSYNDNFGHPEGDIALKLVAHCLKDTLRGVDVAARMGGEEFSILLPQTNSQKAAIIGERIREKVATTEFPNRQVTVSIGVASCPNAICTAQEIIKWADDALYEAKRRGRNNVQIYENLSNDDG
jgi:diguanylate cyclase (GGDEF)-like protein